MNIVELSIFLLLTGAGGAIVGGILCHFTGSLSKGAELGACAGPVVTGVAVTLYISISGVLKKLMESRKNEQHE